MSQQKTILIPLPSHDFDTTEVVVPWRRCREAGFQIVFAAPDGKRAYTDPYLLTGVIFGKLGAAKEVVELIIGSLNRTMHFCTP